MRERPILFSGEMVRAILDGRKTQTRRVVKPQPVMSHNGRKIMSIERLADEGYFTDALGNDTQSRYGQPGDRLLVLKTRITLEITEVRVERLQEISNSDVFSEGGQGFHELEDQYYSMGLTGVFAQIWESINGKKHPWESNPWVWVISFKRVEG